LSRTTAGQSRTQAQHGIQPLNGAVAEDNSGGAGREKRRFDSVLDETRLSYSRVDAFLVRYDKIHRIFAYFPNAQIDLATLHLTNLAFSPFRIDSLAPINFRLYEKSIGGASRYEILQMFAGFQSPRDISITL